MGRPAARPRAPSMIRTLPRVTAPVPGESLDSWLEATAVRCGVTLRDIYAAMGFPSPFSELWRHINRQLADTDAAAIAAATGRTPEQVRNMTLSRYSALAGIDDTGRFTRAAPWARVHGSRFCPECLAATGGVWMLRWRLVWTFACAQHHCLLVDQCPRCGDAQRYRYRVGPDAPHPGQCANPSRGTAGARRPRCDADLGETPTMYLSADHPALAAQATIDALIDDGTGAFGIYARHRLPAMAILADIRALGQGLLRAANVADLDRIVPGDVADRYRATILTAAPEMVEPRQRPGGERRFKEKPPLAIETAAAVTAALRILSRPTVDDAAEALVALHPFLDRAKLENNITMSRPVSGSASPVLHAVYIVSLGDRLTSVGQLRCRIGSALPGRPAPDLTHEERLAARVPALLWSAWALRLCLPTVFQRAARAALAAAVLLVGSTMTVPDAAAALGDASNRNAVIGLLGHLSQTPQWPDIRSVLIRLADYLDTTDVPIDYARRRRLNYSELLPDAQWTAIARASCARPEGALSARGFLCERLSGSPTIPTPVPTAREVEYFTMLRFPGRLNPKMLEALDRLALDFLATQGITDEPVCWEPPRDLLAGADLPGIDIDTIDTTELHRLLRRDQCTLVDAAAGIGTTADAVRCVLEYTPAPKDPRPGSTPKPGPHRVGPAYLRASTMFPRDRLIDLYGDQHISLRALGVMAGVCKQTMTALVRDYGITVQDSGWRPGLQVNRDWLFTEHLTRGRPLRDIAHELGVTPSVMTKWAKVHQLPVRAPRHRTIEDLRANKSTPPLLLPALAGQGGWERLQRFVVIAGYPNFHSAATELGLHRTVLGQQVGHLERDLGGRLIEPSDGRRPMRITPFGQRVREAVLRFAADGGP